MVLFTGVSALAQENPPAASPAPPTPVLLEYTGKPVTLPFRCAAEEINAAGLTCTEEDPCPAYLELNAAYLAGNRILVAGNIHSANVTLSSTLLGSEDGGRIWRELGERVRGANLDTIHFVDSDTGWVSGELLVPLAQDPFFLVTTDGGKSWRQRDIFGESAENRYGTIQQFAFADKQTGGLIIDRGQGSDEDRYERYESPDGGESWTMKESSKKPLRLKAPAPAPDDWRVRVDASTQSFHVEQRQGERWHSIAAFAVKLGACKPE